MPETENPRPRCVVSVLEGSGRMSTGVDYSAWDHIYVSDDEDVTSPFVDTASLFRMRHRVRDVSVCRSLCPG